MHTDKPGAPGVGADTSTAPNDGADWDPFTVWRKKIKAPRDQRETASAAVREAEPVPLPRRT